MPPLAYKEAVPLGAVDVNLAARGLPCRANCGFRIDVTALAQRDEIAFRLLCQARIDHEHAAHGYDHATVSVPKARYSWGRSSRHVLTGQGI